MVILFEEKFKIPIYRLRVFVAVTDDVETYLGEAGVADDTKHCGGVVYDFSDRIDAGFHFLLVVHDRSATYGTLVHESNHITKGVFRKVGIPLNEDTEEAECYLQEYIFNVLVKLIKKCKDGNTDKSKET